MMKKRALTFLLCAAMVFSNFVPVMADENENDGASETYEEQESWGDTETEDIPEYADTDVDDDGQGEEIVPVFNDDAGKYSIAISDKKISFGTQTVGYPIMPQTVMITNTGNQAVSLIWKDVDPDCAFVVDVTRAQNIAPGQAAPVNVSVSTNKGIGAYSGVLLFADSTDTGYASGVKLETSVTIVEDAPSIKRVTISPAETNATAGSSVNFSAEVEGNGDFDPSVKFSVKGNKSENTVISGEGRLVIAGDETASSLTVVAASVQDPSVSREAKVTLEKGICHVNVYSNPGRGGDVTGGGTYEAGSRVVLKAYADNGFYFDGWEINGEYVSSGTTYTIDSISGNIEAVALFVRDCVRIKAQPNHKSMGSVEGDGLAEIGDTVVLKAKAKSGYRFKCWMEGKKKISSESKLKLKNVQEDRELTAVFTKDECVVSVASCDTTMGTVSGGKTVSYGKDVTIKATANKGYKFVRWVCNDQEISKSAEYKLKEMKDDITVVAIFAPEKGKETKTYTLTSGTVDANGVISPCGAVVMEQGKSINYTISPKSGYQIAAIAIDGKQVPVSSSITISDVKADHTIVAAFLPIQNAPKPSADVTKKSQEAAQGSDLNTEVQAAPEKKYEENVMDADIDVNNFVGDREDSMDNDLDREEGVLQEVNLTSDEAVRLLGDDAFKYELVKRAIASENLEVKLDNGMRKNKFVMSYEEAALENPETANFAKILCGVFSDDEIMALVSGQEQVSVGVSITGVQEDDVPLGQISKIKESLPAGKQVGQYFYSNFMKNVDGQTTEITEFDVPLMVMIDIPDQIYKSGKTYQIARLHTNADGSEEVTILDDLGNDPKTITFETDRFSTYAIICDNDIKADVNLVPERPTIKKETDWVVVSTVGVICAATTALVILFILQVTMGRKKRRRSAR